MDKKRGRGGEGGGKVDNYAIINIYITKVVVFAEVSFKRFKVHLQSRQNIISILTITFQSQKVWSVKNQISAANRLKNGTSKIVVSKISISALNTVYIDNKSSIAEFGLRSRYCCRNTQIFVLFIKKKLCTCIS